MGNVGPSLLAFLIASIIASLELITSKYPRTFFLLKNSRALYLYAFIYGAIGGGVLLGLQSLIDAKLVKLEGLGLSNAWVQALVVGLSVKAFLHIRLFSVNVAQQSFPVGVETIVQLFEPWLLRTIELDHFNAGRNFVGSRAAKFPDPNSVKNTIKANVPPTFSSPEKAAFSADVDKATTVVEMMELFLGFLGRGSFDRVFPP